LALLVQDYEARNFAQAIPDPIEAIRFRMEQQCLSQRDLVPYFGSRSKVSEVLSGKRPLTLTMIRALHKKLGIPARALLHDRDETLLETDVAWDRFPVYEMAARGWVKASLDEVRDRYEEVMRTFLQPLGTQRLTAVLYRRTENVRSVREVDRYALAAWTARIMLRALEAPPKTDYRPGTVTPAFMSEVARLSWSETGPRLAKEFLENHGIAVVIEPHLPKTHLDGAAVLLDTGRPVIGLSLRHDRIDNFWFCLMHELAHVSLHLSKESDRFYDDLDTEVTKDPRENEADQAAGEALIPQREWKSSLAQNLRTPEAAEDLASRLRVHPAIVAGRMRHQSKKYKILNKLVGHGEVRRLFPEIKWL
jgi:HTH-type transcriptional regulator / antitoxin HigA